MFAINSLLSWLVCVVFQAHVVQRLFIRQVSIAGSERLQRNVSLYRINMMFV